MYPFSNAVSLAGRKETPTYGLIDSQSAKADISEKIKPHAWEKLLWRWVVERTFGWLNHSRRLSKDYEITTDSAAMVIISHCHTLLKRL